MRAAASTASSGAHDARALAAAEAQLADAEAGCWWLLRRLCALVSAQSGREQQPRGELCDRRRRTRPARHSAGVHCLADYDAIWSFAPPAACAGGSGTLNDDDAAALLSWPAEVNAVDLVLLVLAFRLDEYWDGS